MKRIQRVLGLAATSLLLPLLSGCSANVGTTTATKAPVSSEVNSCTTSDVTSPAQPTPVANYAGVAFMGTVRAGAKPLIGSSVQVYSAGSAGNGSAPKALLPAALISDANGQFSVSASFTCPYNTSVIYVVATGGATGAGDVSNNGTVLATVLGTCESLTSGANFVVNELTTVATATAMAPFLTTGGRMGATATNSLGIALAAATATNLVNIYTGSGSGAGLPATGTAPTARLDSLANLLNACIVSGVSSTACTRLYAATATSSGTPSNTLDAAVNLAKHPGSNVATLFGLSSASAAFAPSLSAAPVDWTTFITYTGGGMNRPTAIAIDSVGNVRIASYYSAASVFSNAGVPLLPSGIVGHNLEESYGAAVDVNDAFWVVNQESNGINNNKGSVTLLDTSGQSPATYTAGGVYFPEAIAFDTSGTAWIADYGDSSVTLLDSSGTSQSGSAGYPPAASGIEFPASIAIDSKCNGYVANNNDTVTRVIKDGSSFTTFQVPKVSEGGVAVDPSDNVWVTGYTESVVALISSAGTVVSGDGYTDGGIDQPSGIAIDSAGSVWIANLDRQTGAAGNSLTELAGATTAAPGEALSPSTGFGTEAGIGQAFGVAIDAGGSVWVIGASTNTLTEFVGLATPVKTPLLGPVRVP